MSDISLLNQLKDMVKVLEISLIDAEKLVHKGNQKSGVRIRKNMQQIREQAKIAREMVQFIKQKDN